VCAYDRPWSCIAAPRPIRICTVTGIDCPHRLAIEQARRSMQAADRLWTGRSEAEPGACGCTIWTSEEDWESVLDETQNTIEAWVARSRAASTTAGIRTRAAVERGARSWAGGAMGDARDS